ncbi:inhibitor of growth protein 2 [Drosophila ficusphila]|uniref:inhibitor of growth protein 2 n=1 Tax=Drosophila ficusphila TaxID=30025 RepID=UPI0007E871E3|nr:inhibitor of growth protein 2 [Drosophila ficusphila]
MINPIASESEAINSATYVDNYIDSVENLPDDVQRQLSRIRDIDVQYRGLIRDVDHYYDLYLSLQNSPDAARRSRTISRMHQSLIQAQELGDEKMQIVNHMQEIIDGKLRQLDTDQQNLDLKEERDRYATLLEDGQPSKLQRLQSPMREQGNQAGTGNGGLNGNGLLSAKDHYALGGYAGGVVSGSNALPSGNGGSSTPNSERSSHVSNGGNSGSNGNVSGGGGGPGGDLQRTGSKRSRRRNESLVNNGSSLEMGGNESNSANEASGSGSGERKASLGGGSGAGQGRKANLQAAAGNLASGSASTSSGAAGGGGAGGSGAGVVGGGNNSGKKKKRKVRGSGAANANTSTREETPPPETIDPDEPTYCVCNQISFGEMILCDNDLCPIEWFHFSCVSLVLKPKGKWFCPNCRGERPNVMKPKAQFLKELERYNKEKEEKT